MKRKQNFDNIPCNVLSKIYEYDDTYKIFFNNVLKELVDNYNKKKDNKLKKFNVKILKNEWYNDEFIDYLWPRVNFDIIIKAMKDEIINNPIIFKHIKFIFRSLCHYNNSDGLNSFDDDKNMCPNNEIDDDNEYNDNDTLKTIKMQISNFLKDIIDDSKIEQFLYDFIDDNNLTIDSYCLENKYDDLKQDVDEDYNTKNIFKNYEYTKQPHLYNFKTNKFLRINDDEIFINYKINNRIIAEKLYIVKNGLCNHTIQIRYDYNKVQNEIFYYELSNY